MGNYCSGCCPSFPRLPNSQSPAEPVDPQSPVPNSQSLAEPVDLQPRVPNSQSLPEPVDLPQLYANINDSTELDPLISHVKDLLSVIEQAQSPRDVKKDISIGFVQGMIERAAKFLEAISTHGEALKDDKWALNVTGGMKTVISTALKHVGELHWIAVGFSAIAYVMDGIQQVTSNFQQCVRLLRKLVDLAERLSVVRQRMAPNEAEHLDEAVHAIVEGVISCCCCMSERKIFRYLFASVDKAKLQDIGTVIDELHRSLILMVAMDIQQQIPRRYYATDPQAPLGAVGIDDKIAEVIRLLDIQSKGPARAVILYGFGGAGKTTLGDCVVSKLKRDLDLRGTKYSRIQLGEKSLHEDQQDLYAELKKEEVRFKNFKDGQERLKEVLEKETAFIFIDNALTKDQIDHLLPSQLSLPSGSRLLLTSRTDNVIEELRSRNIVCHKYLVDGLPDEAAKKYFRQIVIRSEEMALALDEGRISLVKMDAVAEECRGVPLLLKVYAQYLEHHGSDSRVYDDILDRLRQGEFSFTDEHLGGILLYVYHHLDNECQEAFVDICTYFHGWEEEDVSYIVSTTVLKRLIGGALVKIDVSNKVEVHDVLRALGIKEGKETRIQSVQDLENVQEANNIKGIWLPDSSWKLESKILIAAKNRLRVLALGRKIRLIGKCDLPFPELRFLNLHGLPIFDSKLLGALRYMRIKTRECPLSNLKSLGHLQKFVFECSGMKMFPNDFRLPASLIELDLSNCKQLQELPAELHSLTRLSKLKLDGCSNLKILPEEFYKLSKLTYLSMKDCAHLQTLPAKFGQLSSLRRMNLSGSPHLETLGPDFGGLSSLESLSISQLNNLVDLTESFGDLPKLSDLTINGCSSLTCLQGRFDQLSNLRSLDLGGCWGLVNLPDELVQLSNLQSLGLVDCEGLADLPGGLGQLGNLQSLDLRGCKGLANLPGGLGQLSNLQTLHLGGCEGLVNLPCGFGQLSNLQNLQLWGSKLTSLPHEICQLGNLEFLNLNACSELASLPHEIRQLSNLRYFYLQCCSKLTSLPHEMGQLGNLQRLDMTYCSELTSLPHEIGQLSNLQRLDLNDCSKLTSLPHEIGQLGKLKYLDLNNCSELTSLPHEIGQLSNLQRLNLDGCSKLTSLSHEIGQLGKLEDLCMDNCSELTSLPHEIGQLGKLKYLSLGYCLGLRGLPHELGHLSCLKDLYLGECSGLSSLPNGLGYLNNLRSLLLPGCERLTSLPETLDHPSKLEILNLNGCSNLSGLPNGLGNLKMLEKLWLSGCTNLSILPESFAKLSGLKELGMANCCALKVLPNDFEDLRSVEWLDVSYCSELEGRTMERVVKLRKLKVLDIRHCPNLTKKWNEMERHKFPIWVKSVEEEDFGQQAMRVIGAAMLQNCKLVDITGESIDSADFIQPGMTVAFLLDPYRLQEEMFERMKDWAISEKWQIIYIQACPALSEEEAYKALEWLPDGSRAIAHSETSRFEISYYSYGAPLYELLCVADVQADDGGGTRFVLRKRGNLREVLGED